MRFLFIPLFAAWAKLHKSIRIGENQGYEGFVIGISNTVKRDMGFIAGMRDKFTRVSKELWDSSGGRTFVSEITIVLPENWEEPTEEETSQYDLEYRGPVSGLSFERMAMQVHHATDELNPHRMYAIKVTPCGHFGKHIRATDNYIKMSDDENVVERHGTFEKVFVREFAKLRWGVFDETVNKDRDEYIFDETVAEIVPAKCSRGLIGTHVYKANFDAEQYKAGDICEKPSHKYHGKCHFIPSSDQTNEMQAKAPWIGSFMYSTAVKDINTFCRESDNDALGHEWRPNTIHNNECSKRSAWEVITESPDFQKFTDMVDLDELKVNIVRDTARRIVLAIDMSTSMQLPGKSFDRYFAVRKAAVQFLQTASLGTYIGLISFDKGARVHSELMKIVDEDSRTVLIKRFPRKEDLVRGTSIGSGILSAIKILEETGPNSLRTHGGEVLLITDGEETVKPFLPDIIERVTSSGVTIHAISLGSDALVGVEMISEETGGLGIFTPATVDSRNTMSVNLQDAFKQQFNGQGETLTVSSEAVDLEDELQIPFILDDSIGQGTKVFLTWPQSVSAENSPEVSLELPSGVVVDENVSESLGFTFTIADSETNSLTIIMPNPSDVGRYTVRIKNPSSEKYSITVAINSFPRDAKSPVKVTAYSMLDDDDRPLVFVEVSQGMFAVIGATVDAQYIHPELDSTDTTEQKYSLHDDGGSDDAIADDGIYTGTIEGDKDGAYSVIRITVSTDRAGSTTYVSREHYLGWGDLNSLRTMPVVKEAADRYRRDAQRGTRVQHLLRQGNIITPANMSTFSIMNITAGNGEDTKFEIKLVAKNISSVNIVLTGLSNDSVSFREDTNHSVTFTVSIPNHGIGRWREKIALSITNNGCNQSNVFFTVKRSEIEISRQRRDSSADFDEINFTRSTSLSLRTKQITCPFGFKHYKNHCWHYNPQKLVFDEAKMYCENQGGVLPLIQNDLSKQAAFRFSFFEESKNPLSDRIISFWISAESNLMKSSYSPTIEVPTKDEILLFTQDQERRGRNFKFAYLAASQRSCPYFLFSDGTWEIEGGECRNDSYKRAILCEKRLQNKTPASRIKNLSVRTFDKNGIEIVPFIDLEDESHSWVHELQWTNPDELGVRGKPMQIQLRLLADVKEDGQFDQSRLLEQVTAQTNGKFQVQHLALSACPPNLPIDLIYYIKLSDFKLALEISAALDDFFRDGFYTGLHELQFSYVIFDSEEIIANSSNIRKDFFKTSILVLEENQEAPTQIKFQNVTKIPSSLSLDEIMEYVRPAELIKTLCASKLGFTRVIKAAAINDDGFIAKPSSGVRIPVKLIDRSARSAKEDRSTVSPVNLETKINSSCRVFLDIKFFILLAFLLCTL